MTVDQMTGEILNVEDAERRASYICTDLDSASESFETAMSRMREAVESRDDITLGYRSPGDYISDRFGGRLARLGVDLRREVVREMTEMGLSSRAIAPIVGVTDRMVRKDVTAVSGGNSVPTSHDAPADLSAAGSTESQDEVADASGVPAVSERDVAPPRPAITGRDGKTYQPPVIKPRPPVAAMSEREIAAEYVGNIARSLTSLMQVTHQERRADLLRAVPLAAGLASPAVADQLTPEHMRAVADGLHDLADEWEQNND